MSLVIHSRAIGSRETKRRNSKPRATTLRPESHTILNTGGTLRSAASRSCHPLQKLSRSAMVNEELVFLVVPTPPGGYFSALREMPKTAGKVCWDMNLCRSRAWFYQAPVTLRNIERVRGRTRLAARSPDGVGL